MVYHQHPKGSSHALSKHPHKINHEFTILSRSNNPEVTSIPKKLSDPITQKVNPMKTYILFTQKTSQKP